MKKRIWISEIALAAVISWPCFTMPVYASGVQGSCFYFDQRSRDAVDFESDDTQEGMDRTEDIGTGMIHWNLGDTLTREIDGEKFRFRCIDQNYADSSDHYLQGALFLCDTVIPANFGSEYRFEELQDGLHGYVFYPGPIVNFGTSNDYKISGIRAWLMQEASESFMDAFLVDTGISYAYEGSTWSGLYEQFHSSDLTPKYIGSQKMSDRLFVLSVDEALKYREYLWRFEGADRDNPQTQIDEYCKSYWLRNPAGNAGAEDTEQVYVVDLVKGSLHPAAVSPSETGKKEAEDKELAVTGVTGVRPAFVLPQVSELTGY